MHRAIVLSTLLLIMSDPSLASQTRQVLGCGTEVPAYIMVGQTTLRDAPFESAHPTMSKGYGECVFVFGRIGPWYAVTLNHECAPVYYVPASAVRATTDVPELSGQTRVYPSPDGSLSATVVTVTRIAHENAGDETSVAESYFTIARRNGRIIGGASYLSENDCGYEIGHAAWTPNSRFFVFGMSQADGQQPWDITTNYFDRRTNAVRSLNDQIGAIAADFRVSRPDVLRTDLYGFSDRPNRPVSMHLSKLTRRASPISASTPSIIFLRRGDVWRMNTDGRGLQRLTKVGGITALVSDYAGEAALYLRHGDVWTVGRHSAAQLTHDGHIWGAVAMRNGTVVTLGSDNRLKVWTSAERPGRIIAPAIPPAAAPSGWNIEQLVVAPDGDSVALLCDRIPSEEQQDTHPDAGDDAIFVVDIDSGKVSTPFERYDSNGSLDDIAYTPDGRSLLLNFEGEDSGSSRLSVLSLSNGAVSPFFRRSRNHPSSCYAPAYSPDYAFLAVTSNVVYHRGQTGVVVMNTDGSDPRLVARSSEYAITWLNDSQELLLTPLDAALKAPSVIVNVVTGQRRLIALPSGASDIVAVNW